MALMSIVEKGQLAGDFEGFEDTDRVFTFYGSGRTWRQDEYKYAYHYAYMPRAQVVRRGGRHYLEVDGMRDSVAVVET
jgi:hypothetical protein